MKTAYNRVGENCPAPDSDPQPPTRFTVPPGAVDTHAHIIGRDLIEQRSFTPPLATGEAYLRMLDLTGMSYGVLVQVSVHGSNNSLMVDLVSSYPNRLRAIGVAPADLPEAGWRALQDQGVVGLRLNTIAGGEFGFDQLDRYESICAELGWHLQFLARSTRLPEIAPRLSRLKIPYIIDHMGAFEVERGTDTPEWHAMLGLVRDGAWTKLSAGFRFSKRPDYSDTLPFARALIEAAPGRCVWGSDWPHVAFWDRMPNVGELLDLLDEWAPEEGVRNAILTTNAHRFYGFSQSDQS
jgi:2-pyrone-4,6-dicarboxylate lactonase